MKQKEIEKILRRMRELRPKRGSGPEERLALLLQRQKTVQANWRRKGERARVEELFLEVNKIYESEVDEDRIRERAKSIRIQHL